MSEQEQWLARATKTGTWGSSAAGGIAALLAFLPSVAGMDEGVAIAAVAAAAVAIAVSGAIVITDAQIRGRVKVAQLQKAATAAASASAPPAADAASVPEASAQWHPVAVPMAITFSGGSDRWGVVALRSEAGGTSSLLVGRTGQPLQVVREDQVGETFYESNPGQYEPQIGP